MSLVRNAKYSLAIACFFVVCKPLSAGEVPVPVGPYVSQLIEARTLAESYVFIAKDHLSRAGSDYRIAKRKYDHAHSNYAAYLHYLEDAVRRGDSTQLGGKAAFLRLSRSASAAGKDFVLFVDTKTPPSEAATAQLYRLEAAGIGIGQGTSDITLERRMDFVKTLDQLARWHSWMELTSAQRDAK